MSPTFEIILLWLAFAGSHLLLSSVPVRSAIIGRIGEPPFRGLYSLVAFAFFIPLTWIYFSHRHEGPLLWSVPIGPALRWFVYVTMALSFVLLVASFVQPSPATVGVASDAAPRGVLRLTRHPLLMALALFGLVHLLPERLRLRRRVLRRVRRVHLRRRVASGPAQAGDGARVPRLLRADAVPAVYRPSHVAGPARAADRRRRGCTAPHDRDPLPARSTVRQLKVRARR
jgi:hypothetical protein